MQEIGVQDIPLLVKYYFETSKLGLIYPLNDFIVVCQKPNILRKNNNGLHCENGPALAYNDNGISEWYYLNGVSMKKEHVMTHSQKLNPKEILAETNVEARRELIRKIGIEMLLNHLPHKIIDKKDNYELLDIELNNEVKHARYLKMINPSISVFHVEGVSPECLTVQHAINWRSFGDINKKWKPEILT